jgi:hypothetical protein
MFHPSILGCFIIEFCNVFQFSFYLGYLIHMIQVSLVGLFSLLCVFSDFFFIIFPLNFIILHLIFGVGLRFLCVYFSIGLYRSHNLTCIFDMPARVGVNHFFSSTFDWLNINFVLFFISLTIFFSRLP